MRIVCYIINCSHYVIEPLVNQFDLLISNIHIYCSIQGLNITNYIIAHLPRHLPSHQYSNYPTSNLHCLFLALIVTVVVFLVIVDGVLPVCLSIAATIVLTLRICDAPVAVSIVIIILITDYAVIDMVVADLALSRSRLAWTRRYGRPNGRSRFRGNS